MLVAHVAQLARGVGLHGLAASALLSGSGEDAGFLRAGGGDEAEVSTREAGTPTRHLLLARRPFSLGIWVTVRARSTWPPRKGEESLPGLGAVRRGSPSEREPRGLLDAAVGAGLTPLLP